MSKYPRKFLNQGFTVADLQVRETKKGDPFLQVQFKKGDRKFYWFAFYPTGGYDPESKSFREGDKYAAGPRAQVKQDLVDLFSAMTSPKKVEDALSHVAGGFRGTLEALMSIAPLNAKIDLFLEYEKDIRDGNDRTYLNVPKSGRFGKIFAPPTTDKYNMINSEDGLYFLSEKGVKHPFTREAWWATSDYANPKGVVKDTEPTDDPRTPVDQSNVGPSLDEPSQFNVDYDDDLPF